MTPCILRVAVLCPLRKLFDYFPVSTDCPTHYTVGARVLVPFQSRQRIGIIVEITNQTDCPLNKMKAVTSLLDTAPLLNVTHLELLKWVARYYQVGLGEVLETALPARLRKVSQLSVKPRANKKTTQPNIEKTKALCLNPEQQHAVDRISKTFNTFQTFLLFGITGSGKTEVYCHLIQKVLNEGKQVLILVPEIGLTPQLLTRLEQRFAEPIALLHSSLTEKQRLEAWEQAKEGKASIIIGTRSATFVPLKNPGLFIIDEEHDPSFKQKESFRYHARDCLIKRASLEQQPIILGSATPCLETLHNAALGRFQQVSLPNRAGNATLPSVDILDIRHKKLQEGLSSQLIATIQEHLDRKEQVLVFLNRRGFAPVLMCLPCQWIADCPQCDAHLTVHQHNQMLKCHHCEYNTPIPQNCPNCQHKPLTPVGLGTERLEQFLNERFPDHTIARIDRDSTMKKNALHDRLDNIVKGNTHLLLGTQIIAKGHHFPNVTLVAIIDTDQALFSNDFRSLERMGQLITQVSGRTGRADKPGHVVVQTTHPHHPLLKLLLEKGYLPFASKLLTERKLIDLPPYTYQTLIRAEAKKPDKALEFLHFIKQKSAPDKHLTLLGPVPAPMEKRVGHYRAQLLLQSSKRAALQRWIHELLPHLENFPRTQALKWTIDVDPIETY